MGKVLVASANPGTSSWSPTGIATIGPASTSTTIALPTGHTYTGALVSFASNPGSSSIVRSEVGKTELTITVNAQPEITIAVAYLVID